MGTLVFLVSLLLIALMALALCAFLDLPFDPWIWPCGICVIIACVVGYVSANFIGYCAR